MGGESIKLPNNDDSLEDLILCEAHSGAVVKANCRASVDSTVREGSTYQELVQKIHNLLASESTENEGLIERIQLQNECLHENSEQKLENIREEIKSYRPGDGIHEVGGKFHAEFAIPKVTTLLIVGSAGAGKSCLINNMIRVLDNVTGGYDRAQTYGDTGNGSLFLQEYFLYENARHFCVFDSRGFSKTDISEDLDVIKKWMLHGVCHGEPVCRLSDTKIVREALEGRGRHDHSGFSLRRVDFVIFVVNAFTVHQMREYHDVAALQNLALLYKSPFLSFMDDVPVVVMTHGDKLAPQQRVLTRIFIGELLGVSPVDQVFDISCFTERTVNPGDVDTVNDLVVLNMLKFSLERADKNLPCNTKAALFPIKIHGLMSEGWKQLDTRHLLFIVILCWLLSAIFITMLHNLRSDPGLRNSIGKAFRRAHKKLQHGHPRQYRL